MDLVGWACFGPVSVSVEEGEEVVLIVFCEEETVGGRGGSRIGERVEGEFFEF